MRDLYNRPKLLQSSIARIDKELEGAVAANDGVEVIINIRRLQRDQKIIVVVEKEGVKAMAMRVGADVVVMKPISADMVLH